MLICDDGDLLSMVVLEISFQFGLCCSFGAPGLVLDVVVLIIVFLTV